MLDKNAMQTLLCASRVTIWRWVKDGLIPEPIYIGNRPLWHKSTVEKFLSKKGVVIKKKRNLDEFI